MYQIIGYTYEGRPYNYMEFQCDYESDVQTLPTSADGSCAIGSKAFITETNNVYKLNNHNEWKIYGNTMSSGGSANISVADANETKGYLGI